MITSSIAAADLIPICRDCRQPALPEPSPNGTTSGPYWYNELGQPINPPRCRTCHEDRIRRLTREGVYKGPEFERPNQLTGYVRDERCTRKSRLVGVQEF